MNKSIRWLRISYWVGIIVDGLVTIAWINPGMIGLLDSDSGMGIATRIALGWGASLLLAWTFLLFWADRKPLERKGVLLLTCFPVISGLCLTNVFGFINDIIPPGSFIASSLLLLVIMALMLGSYLYAGRRQSSENSGDSDINTEVVSSSKKISLDVTKNITKRLNDQNKR